MTSTFSFLVRCALALAAIVATAGPAAAADKETRQMMADIRILQEQLQETQILLTTLADTVKTLNTRFDTRLDQQSEATRKLFADQKLAVDAVAGDLRIVRERMDDNNVRIGSLTQEVDALRQTVLGLRPSPSSAATPDSADPSAAATPAPAAPAAPAIAGGLSPQRTFDMAKADFMIGQFELAISGFEGYLRSFPKSEQAGEAQLIIGNSNLQIGKYDKAIEAYDLTIRTYPKSSAVPEATYRKGLAHINLRQMDAARTAFETVVRNYPDTLEALLAKQQLEKLSPPTKKP